MSTPNALLLLGVGDAGAYVSVVKVAIFVLLFFVWALTAQWVDRDTDTVKTRREQWNLIVISGGAVATFVLFAVPLWGGGLFAVGILFWILLAGGSLVAYVVHRNGRVVGTARVLTVGHVKRLLGSQRTKKVKDKGLRVQICDHKGDFVGLPEDPEDALAFQGTQDFLFDLIWRRASDADILAGKENYRLVYRIDGVATERPDGIPVEEGERIFRYLKKIAGLNVEEIRRPQTGHIEATLLSHQGDVSKAEVHTSGTTAGERMRLRLQANAKIMRLHELGLPEQRLKSIKQVMAKSSGVFLLSAPSQHGLTTTQYAVLRAHDAYMNNIHVLERRPLAELDNMTQQRYEGANSDVNYARMLQTVFRREPDIVMVGECEDRETALIATRGAAGGRKVYLGMQADDSFEAMNRYLTLLNDNRMAAKCFLGVINQRLVRILCKDCRETYEPDAGTLKKLNIPADKIEHFYRPPSEPKKDKKGREIVCMNCQGAGYVGRTGVFEFLRMDDPLRKLIEEGVAINRIKAYCRKNKMYYLMEEGMLKVIDGTTSMNEVLRSAQSKSK